jgi:serine phosphatase RsbU (regulator of sigma subunit)
MSTARHCFGLGPEQMTEGILREVATFSQHQRQSDDITLLVVQRR